MFDGALNRLLGTVEVTETGNTINVLGMPGEGFGKQVTKHWSTSKIIGNMFNHITPYKINFNKFFAIDVLYMLQELAKAPQQYGVNRRALLKAIEELQENTWLAGLTEMQPAILDLKRVALFNRTPLDHQARFLEHYNEMVPRYNLLGYMLAAKPGAGKTLTGLMLGECLNSEVFVIISPNNAVYKVWKKTILEEYKKPYTEKDLWVSSDGKPLERGKRFYIFHYEALNKLQDLVSMVGGKRLIVIIDESHNFNEQKSQRTQFLVNFVKRSQCQHTLWSSGTPVKALGYEMIPCLTTIDPFFDNDTEQRFRKIFGKSASKAVEILRNRIGLVSFKVDKQEFTKKKPEEVQVDVQIPDPSRFTLDQVRKDMSDFIVKQMEHYQDNFKTYRAHYDAGIKFYESLTLTKPARDQLNTYKRYVAMIIQNYDPVAMKDQVMFCNQIERNEIIPRLPQPLRNEFKNARSVVKYLPLKVQGEALGRVLGKRRAECNAALIQYAGLPGIIDNAEKKTVIFTSFVDVAEQTVAYLKGKGYQPQIVHQGTNKNLPAIIDKFARDENCNPLVATFQSLSTAVPLTMANAVVLMNQPFRDFEREQAISRADRIGQDAQVFVYNVLLDTKGQPNISTRAADIVQWSREQVAAIMGTEVVDESAVSLEQLMDAKYFREFGYEMSLEILTDILADVAEDFAPPKVTVREALRPRSSAW